MLKKRWLLFAAITFIAVLLISCSDRNISEKNGEYRITVGGADWVMILPSKGYELAIKDSYRDVVAHYMFKNNQNNLNVTIYIKRAIISNDARVYRDIDSEDVKYIYSNAKNIIKYDYPGCFLLEYFLPEYKNKNAEYRNMDIYYVKSGYLVNIHLASIDYSQNKKELFLSYVKSIKFEPRTVHKLPLTYRDSISAVTLFYYEKGRNYSGWDNFEKAFKYYQVAFENDWKLHTLDKYSWHVLVTDLALCYGNINDMENCIVTLNYDISKDPIYYRFYYYLAQAYAKTDNPDSCISNLKAAYRLKNKYASDEEFPDISDNNVFDKFKRNNKYNRNSHKLGTKN